MKTAESRAKELYQMVHGKGDGGNYFHAMNPAVKIGWVKLGKFVLSLEKKFNALKKISPQSKQQNEKPKTK